MDIAYKISKDISNYVIYLQLTLSLTPGKYGGIADPKIKNVLLRAKDFLDNANKRVLIDYGPRILNLLEPIVERSKRNFPLKIDIEKIVLDFDEYSMRNPNIYSYGVEYGWLVERMDCGLIWHETLPYHTKIGLGHHAGYFVLQEQLLLEDSFFLLALAERESENLMNFGKTFEFTPSQDFTNNEEYLKSNWLNTNTCMFSRIGIINFYSFIEALVNSIGYDYLLRKQGELEKYTVNVLKGLKNNKYLSLEYKLEKFHQIIRNDKKQVFSTAKESMKEPFKTFLSECKVLRDSSMHFSPYKESIWLKPLEWLEKIRNYSNVSLNLAREFWSSCFPNKGFPDYLRNLDYETVRKDSLKRLNATNEI